MAAVYRARNGAEFVLDVPAGFVEPKVVVLELERGGTRQFKYAGDGRCWAHIAHGPGHQSVSRCERLGTHDEHTSYGYDWTDSDMTPTPEGRARGRYGPTIAWSDY